MSGTDRLSHDECTCEPKVESAVYCPYCGGETYYNEHRVDAEIPEVFCENTTMSTPRYCMGCGDSVGEYDLPHSDTVETDRETAEKVLRPVVEAAREEGRYADEDWEGTVLDSIISADLGLSTAEKTRLVKSLEEHDEAGPSNTDSERRQP